MARSVLHRSYPGEAIAKHMLLSRLWKRIAVGIKRLLDMPRYYERGRTEAIPHSICGFYTRANRGGSRRRGATMSTGQLEKVVPMIVTGSCQVFVDVG